MCAVLLVPFVNRKNVTALTLCGVTGLIGAMVATSFTFGHGDQFRSIFSGMLTIDYFSQFFKILLMGFSLLVLVQWCVVSRKRTHVYDVPDFLCLLLGAVLGMSLMVCASNLLMIFLAVETASLPSYALAGFRKKLRKGSEGALKYVIFGSASSAIMLYGMSLIYGSAGTLNLAGIALHAQAGVSPLMGVGLAALMAGLAFKLSAVPMHFWCPDVFEGAPIEVTTFLSVASKGAAVCLLVRVLHLFGPISPSDTGVGFGPMAVGVAIVGGITATWGNLVALHQTNIKRLLAYSSIAHAGYMTLAASVIMVSGVDKSAAVGAILFYLFVYVFMNLGAFTVVALVSEETGSEELEDYSGLMGRSPTMAILLSMFLLSLFGMPGLGGFMGKIFLMKSMSQAGLGGFVLVAVLLLNTLISLYYYMRPVYFMAFVADTANRPSFMPRGIAVGMLFACAGVLFWTGLLPAKVSDYTNAMAHIRPVVSYQESSSETIQAVVPRPTAPQTAMGTTTITGLANHD